MVVHGYDHVPMLLAMALCRWRGIPYLMRGESRLIGPSTGMRRHLRTLGTRLTCIGQ